MAADATDKLTGAIDRAGGALRRKWDRERSEEPEPLYDFTWHIEFGGGRKLGCKLRADHETGMWVKSFLEGWPAESRVFGFTPAKGDDRA